MRTSAVVLLLGFGLLSSPDIQAKFGISKTRVTLPRVRPPASPLLAETVAVEVKGSHEVSSSQMALVRGEVEEALQASDLYRIVERPREADAVVRVKLEDVHAEVRDEVEIERRRVKVGERKRWDDKKKKEVKEDIWADRDFPVSWRVAEGGVGASVEVENPDGQRTRDASSSYSQRFKKDQGYPSEASSEEELRRFLVGRAARNAAAEVAFSPDPVDVMLAVDGELKAGNRLAEAGLFREALAEWSRQAYKGDKEAARLHNAGVAHEALAYGLPPQSPEHRQHLEQASDHYRKALATDPDEKYFKDPVERIRVSLDYCASAEAFMANLNRFRDEMEQRRRRAQATPLPPPPPEPAPTSAPRKTTAPVARASAPPALKPMEPKPTLSASGSVATPLRNGSFESSLVPWSLVGKGTVVQETGRGRVLEIPQASEPAGARQAVSIDMENASGTLSLDYRVTSGTGQLRVLIAYLDGAGRDRTTALEVSPGEGPGGWSSWSSQLGAIRPRPVRVKELLIEAEGGTLRVDNVSLTVK